MKQEQEEQPTRNLSPQEIEELRADLKETVRKARELGNQPKQSAR